MEVDEQDVIYQETTLQQGVFLNEDQLAELAQVEESTYVVDGTAAFMEPDDVLVEEPEPPEPEIAFNGTSTNIDEEEKIAEEMAEVMKELQGVVSTDEGSKRKLEETEPESSNVDEPLENGVEGEESTVVSSDGPTPAKKAHLEVNVRKLLPDLEKHWKPVEDDPNDFTAWTYLLQFVDQENELLAAREAYDSFLARYPYCYGYWKKYADYEKRKGSAEDCEKVFHRGLKAIPLSVDLWIHYLNYVKATHEHDQTYVREQFDKAIQTVGMEFRSDKLWEHYLHYEKESGNLRKLMAIYDQLLATPTQSYQQHFQNLKEFVNANAPQDILSEAEYAEIKDATKEAPVEDSEEAPAETEAQDEIDTKIRDKILERRAEVHKKTEEEIVARWPFEEAIKRPYFHVKPLEKGQLKMWKEYLDFEIERGNEKRIMILFERCLIACALYEEYWIKYIKYLQSQPEKNLDKLRDVFTRACTIHHPSKPWINLHWAAFEESAGNWDTAADILEKLEKVIPNALHLYFRRINLERRRGNLDRCVELFEKYTSDGNNKSNMGHIKIKYARFVSRLLNDYEKAKQILQEAIGDDEGTRAKTIMSLIDLALDQNPVDFPLIISTFDQALESDLPNEQKVTFAHRKIEFLEDYGADVDSIEKAEEQLQSIAKQMRDKKASTDSRGGDEPPKTTTNGAYGPGGSSSNPTNQYNQGGGGGGGGGNQGGSGPGYNQYGQYSNWNYQQSTGYGYNQQGWSAYGGYYG